MTVLVDWQIQELCEQHQMLYPFDVSLINPTSIDLRIGYTAEIERENGFESICLKSYTKQFPFLLHPNFCILVASLEVLNIPDHVCAQFRLKSSRGREFYEHMEAGFIDPGFSQSKLTMEIKNVNQYKSLPLYPELRIGQLIFSKLDAVPKNSYTKVGRYNNCDSVQRSLG